MPQIRAILGERIASYRGRAGFTHRSTAEALKIAASTVARIETGKSWPEFPTLEALAKLYSCSVDDFFADLEQKPKHDSPTFTRIVSILRRFDEEKLRLSLNLIRLMEIVTPEMMRMFDSPSKDKSKQG